VVGSQTVYVNGKSVSAWRLECTNVDVDNHQIFKVTWNYAKSNGMRLSSSYVRIDSIDGHTVYWNWGNMLTDTNTWF
jgi:hypothetical protein